MAPEDYLSKRFVLPNLKLINVQKVSSTKFYLHCKKTTEWEVYRKCPTKSFNVHDHRISHVMDQKFRNKYIKLVVHKRRFCCPNCKSVFTEVIDGIKLGYRTTERYREQLLFDYTNFENTKAVSKVNKCSDTLVSTIVNQRLELQLKNLKILLGEKLFLLMNMPLKETKRRPEKRWLLRLLIIAVNAFGSLLPVKTTLI